jgi:hypothetical protein
MTTAITAASPSWRLRAELASWAMPGGDSIRFGDRIGRSGRFPDDEIRPATVPYAIVGGDVKYEERR